MKLKDKKILLGITGSIAAFKAIDLLRALQREGADVQVMVTKSALQFVTKVTLEALSGHVVLDDLFENGKAMEHVYISRQVDLILIAPTTANMLAKLAYGIADCFVSTTVLAANVPILIAPAMNTQMWKNYLVQENVMRLKNAGYIVLDTESGLLACGENGEGRFQPVELIVWHVIKALTSQDLQGKKVLVSAGATREYLDPVRFLANGSSGKMGMALAFEAFFRGAEVVVVGANLDNQMNDILPFKLMNVGNAEQMADAVFGLIAKQDIFIAAAAVADFCFENTLQKKLPKSEMLKDAGLKLKFNIDILSEVIRKRAKKRKPILVGFALETEFEEKVYRKKFLQKPVDLLVCTTPLAFGADQIEAFLMDGQGVKKTGLVAKDTLSRNVIDHIVKLV